MKKKPIRVHFKEATGEAIHINREGKKTVISGLPPRAPMKAVLARMKVLELEDE